VSRNFGQDIRSHTPSLRSGRNFRGYSLVMNQPFVAHLRAAHPGDAAHVNASRREQRRAPRKHVRSHKRFHLGRIVALAMTGVMSFSGAGVATAAWQLTDNIDSIITEDRLETLERPEVIVAGEDEYSPQPLNILLLGLDGRNTAENSDLGGGNDASIRSDTALIMHIAADRQQVSMISIPRDSIVNIPECPTTTPGLYAPARQDTRFNAAFAYANVVGRDAGSGALCAMYTVETLTNVRMDGFIAVDFAGFRNMVDALGGVEMCIPNYIHAPLAGGLRLSPGRQTLNGWQTLQLARARKGSGLDGFGSDLGRIQRQQDILAAIALDVLSRNLLTDAPALLQFLGATTSSMVMSDNFSSITGLAGLAQSLQNIRPNNIEFITVPNTTNPANPNTVIWTEEADQLWNALRYSGFVSDADTEDIIESDTPDLEAASTTDTIYVGENGIIAAPAPSDPGTATTTAVEEPASGTGATQVNGADTVDDGSDAASSIANPALEPSRPVLSPRSSSLLCSN